MKYLIENVKNHILYNRDEYCTADYGTRQPDYTSHHGIDVISVTGICPAIAVADGEVVRVQDGVLGHDETVYTAGNFVRIKHPNGLYSRYLHLAPNSICVKLGQRVKAGDKLGVIGDTGYSFGVHLHFDVNDGSKYLDPLPYLLGDKSFYDDEPDEPEPTNPTADLRCGDEVTLKNAPLYGASTSKSKATTVSGTYWVHSDGIINGRIRITTPKGCADCTGWVCIADLEKVSSSTAQKKSIKIGDTVKVKSGAKTYDGGALAVFVYTQNYEVMELKGDRAVIGQHGQVTAAVNKADLTAV